LQSISELITESTGNHESVLEAGYADQKSRLQAESGSGSQEISMNVDGRPDRKLSKLGTEAAPTQLDKRR
jgi:hypothetical protein